MGCAVARAWFEETRLEHAHLHGLKGLDEAFVQSIDVGSVLLVEDAKAWPLEASQAQ